MEDVRILDTHLHLWDPAVLRYPWLSGALLRRFGPEDWRAAAEQAGPAERAAVFVQAECDPEDSLGEVDWVTRTAGGGSVRGIVARAALETGDAVFGHLDALRERPLVVGVRRLLQDETPGFAASAEFLTGVRGVAERGLVFDACVRSGQLPELVRLADEVPELTMVLDHLGKPDVSGLPTDAWLQDLAALADHPQVMCKLSGLPAEAAGAWTETQLTPFLDAALAAFGAHRLVFGGDWPISTPYARWEHFVGDWARSRVPQQAEEILWGNGERIYGLR